MSSVLLTDELGPRGRRRVRIATAVSTVVIVGIVAWALYLLNLRGQLEPELYTDLLDVRVFRRLFLAWWEFNILPAVVAMVLSLFVGLALALGRLAQSGIVRVPVGLWLNVARAVPVLLFIFLVRFGMPRFDLSISNFQVLVFALVLYNSAVLAEVFRAGIRSLGKGQGEAAMAIGMTYWQSMRLILVPQAVLRMLPAIIAQLVVILKDTTLAYIIANQDTLRVGRQISEFLGNRMQTMLLVALIFVLSNFVLARFATWLEGRQRRRYQAGAAKIEGGPADLATMGSR